MKIFDLIIIGAGPAGLMASIVAARSGLRVLVLEKNDRAGIKLMMTGGGRCNLTNVSYENIKDFSTVYGPASSFIFSSFLRFGPKDTISFFEERGLKLREEDAGRVFPESNRARSVLNVLLKEALDNSVVFKYRSEVKSIISVNDKDKKIEKIELINGEFFKAHNYILATGGKSYPLTGSSGDAYQWLKDLGHRIVKVRPGLKAIKLRGGEFKDLEGLSFSQVKLSLGLKDEKLSNKNNHSVQGDIIFTKDSLSGPAALNLSLLISDLKPEKALEIDFFPEKTNDSLSLELQSIFHEGKKSIKNSLLKIIPSRFVDFLLHNLEIDTEKLANSVSKTERELIVKNLKSYVLKIDPEKDFSQAMISRGGLDLKEVEPNTFRSKLYSNLYIVGELLDIAAPTGGFNLQLAWTSAYLAASSLLEQ